MRQPEKHCKCSGEFHVFHLHRHGCMNRVRGLRGGFHMETFHQLSCARVVQNPPPPQYQALNFPSRQTISPGAQTLRRQPRLNRNHDGTLPAAMPLHASSTRQDQLGFRGLTTESVRTPRQGSLPDNLSAAARPRIVHPM